MASKYRNRKPKGSANGEGGRFTKTPVGNTPPISIKQSQPHNLVASKPDKDGWVDVFIKTSKESRKIASISPASFWEKTLNCATHGEYRGCIFGDESKDAEPEIVYGETIEETLNLIHSVFLSKKLT